jgi:hypothetical protein
MMTMMRNAATDKASPFKGSAAARSQLQIYIDRAFVWTRNTHHHSHR